MASLSKVTNDIMQEIGKTSSTLRIKIEGYVGDVTVDLLSQNQGRFTRLEKSLDISFAVGVKYYKLPANFNTIKDTFFQVDSTGEFIAKCRVRTKSEIYRNIEDSEYSGVKAAYIQELNRDHGPDGAGLYLILASEPTEIVYYNIEYYRFPLTTDTDIIKNVKLVKNGVRAELPDYFDKAEIYSHIYENGKMRFKENKRRRKTVSVLMPSKRAGQHNKRMRNIGGGRR